MFDEKIAMILLPIWLASVLSTLYLGFIRPKQYRIVRRLLEHSTPETALDGKDLGLGTVMEGFLLGVRSPLRRLIRCVEGERERSLRVQTEERAPCHYYLPEENREKATVLYGKKIANIWQSLALCLLLTAVFFVLWILASLVFDTSSLQPLFR